MSVWDRLVGQDEVVTRLRAVAAAAAAARAARGRRQEAAAGGEGVARPGHAWLLTGPPGSGRSVAARALAAALQCDRQGCGTCEQCRPVLAGSHGDVLHLDTEGRQIDVADARALARDAARSPMGGRWLVVLVEDADRLNDHAANALLRVLEEPPPATVLLLCAPHEADVLPTVRSRCRTVRLRTPPPADVARTLEAEGVASAEAAWAARAAQGHVGRARRLATDPDARTRRADGLSLVTDLRSVPSALAAAAALVEAATAESVAAVEPRERAETEALRAALGEGATKGGRTRRLVGVRPELKALEEEHRRRRARLLVDALDRALTDVAAFWRDVLLRQVGATVPPVHADLTGPAAEAARSTDAATTVRRLEAVLRTRHRLVETEVNRVLLVEALALALLRAPHDPRAGDPLGRPADLRAPVAPAPAGR